MNHSLRFPRPAMLLTRILNHNLPSDRRITAHVIWPLYLIPWLVIMQLIDPSPLWMVLMVGLLGFFGAGYAWVRTQAGALSLSRRRLGTMLVAGDSLREEFTLENSSSLPLLWAAFEDHSYLPEYNPSQVTSCAGDAVARWHSDAICHRRGVFRLGPHTLVSGDPFGLFRLTIHGEQQETLLVYPRVAHMPPIGLPRGHASGRDRRRRPLNGDLRAPVVRLYQPGDSLRHIHWPITAHRGQIMVTELEEEPSGDLWIVLDLNRSIHRGSGERSTLEYTVILAASLAAELLSSSERRSVGLLAVGQNPSEIATAAPTQDQATILPPQRGQGQLWRILAALAPIQTGALPVADLLHRNHSFLGKGHTVVLITPQIGADAPQWIAELLYLRRSGVESSVLAVSPASEIVDGSENGAPSLIEAQQDSLADLLARQEIPVHFMQAGTPLRAALTYRRRRTVLRTTPTGGVVTYEVEEEVG
ncbi:MAG: DUF58 domain-containing protein [Caldilineaceae bacterium]|nr:DUF58 domain-containing protein [Caldilineaceae bacterium]